MSAPLSEVQQALAEAQLTIIGPQFGIGGDQWTRTRSSGNGVSGPVTSGTPATITGYVRRVDKARLGQSAAGVGVVDIGWMFTGPRGQDVTTGDVLTSVADATLVFTLTGAVEVAGYLAFFAEKGR